jgi:hypothetical protein
MILETMKVKMKEKTKLKMKMIKYTKLTIKFTDDILIGTVMVIYKIRKISMGSKTTAHAGKFSYNSSYKLKLYLMNTVVSRKLEQSFQWTREIMK